MHGNPTIPILATVALGMGLFWFGRGFRDLRVRRLIENTPTSRIRSMAMGLVEVVGDVEPASVVMAPFSGRPCAYWEVDISTLDGKRRTWTVVHRNHSGNPFFVRDETGVAMVYPRGAQCTVQHGVQEECSGLSLPECYGRYMSDEGLSLRLWRLSTLRFRERTLDEGARVFVLGTATPRANSFAVSEGDLAATGTDGPEHRLRTLQEETSAVVRRGENEKTFIISQSSERDVTLGLGLAALGRLVAGPALTLVGLGYWLYALSQARGHH